MKITREQLFSGTRLFILLCLPASLFIVWCGVVLSAFHQILLLLDQIAPSFIGWAWLSLLILYIVSGIVFTRVVARTLRKFFRAKSLRFQGFIASVSGLPFYVLCLLSLMVCVVSNFFPDINAVTAFAGLVGFVCFGAASVGYLLLTFFFLRRWSAVNRQ